MNTQSVSTIAWRENVMRIKHLTAIIVVPVVLFSLTIACSSTKTVKERPYKGQAGRTFINEEGAAAFGLVVELSQSGIVVTDSQTGMAGPFKNVQGNGTTRLTLSNSSAPIAVGGEGFKLIFRSYPSGLKIRSWWWTNQKGKRLGKKKSG
jgi:hypothetical protein